LTTFLRIFDSCRKIVDLKLFHLYANIDALMMLLPS